MTDAEPVAWPDGRAGLGARHLVRVVEGPRTGAFHIVERPGRLTMATVFGADIVVRDRSHPFEAELELPAHGPARLKLRSGTAELLGAPLAAGTSCLWPAHVPLAVGANMIAHGPEEDGGRAEGWAAAAALARALAEPDGAGGTVTEAGATAPDAGGMGPGELIARIRAGYQRLPPRRQQLASGTVALVALGVALVTVPVDALPPPAGSMRTVERVLEEEGLSGLDLGRESGGVIRVSGAVYDREALARASVRLRHAHVPHRFDTVSAEELAAAAEDIARLHGLSAEAVPVGPASVRLTTSPADAATRDELVAAIRADLPMLRDLTLAEGPPRPDAAAPRTVSEAAKRVATVVTGDPAYVLTADGARYFPGALLPSGHVLKEIEDGAILVERSGSLTRIRF